MTNRITTAYIQGVQRSLVEADLVRYANEEEAVTDAESLGEALDEQAPPDAAMLATEGAGEDETKVIAAALADMAEQTGQEADVIEAKAQIIQDAINKLAAEAGSPDDNNVVAGHKPGSVAEGEASAKTTDHNKELANAVPNTAEREDVFSSMPGQQADAGKGPIGSEQPHPGAEGASSQVEDTDELATEVDNDRERANYHGAPGAQADAGKGTQGVEKKAARRTEKLSDILARM